MKHQRTKIHMKACITWGNSWKAPAVSWFRSAEPPITTTGLCKGNTHFIKIWPVVHRGHDKTVYTASCIKAASVCQVVPAVHVSVSHSTQSMDESRSRHHQAGTWSGYKQPQETARCKIQPAAHICSVTKCLSPPSEISNGRCCIARLLCDIMYCILLYHCVVKNYNCR